MSRALLMLRTETDGMKLFIMKKLIPGQEEEKYEKISEDDKKSAFAIRAKSHLEVGRLERRACERKMVTFYLQGD